MRKENDTEQCEVHGRELAVDGGIRKHLGKDANGCHGQGETHHLQ